MIISCLRRARMHSYSYYMYGTQVVININPFRYTTNNCTVLYRRVDSCVHHSAACTTRQQQQQQHKQLNEWDVAIWRAPPHRTIQRYDTYRAVWASERSVPRRALTNIDTRISVWSRSVFIQFFTRLSNYSILFDNHGEWRAVQQFCTIFIHDLWPMYVNLVNC